MNRRTLQFVIFNLDKFLSLSPEVLTMSSMKYDPVLYSLKLRKWPYDKIYNYMKKQTAHWNSVVNYIVVYSNRLKTYKLIRWNPVNPKDIIEKKIHDIHIQDLIKHCEKIGKSVGKTTVFISLI